MKEKEKDCEISVDRMKDKAQGTLTPTQIILA
jgi:hypothetical protein